MTMGQQNWQPLTDSDMLKARAALLRHIRHFFDSRQVLEVDTPILSRSAGTEPSLHPVTALLDNGADQSAEYFLHTSPEFAMKRLLAAGSGPIYQLARSFRNGEAGKQHNPEFILLEWYRPGFTMTALMDEVDTFIGEVLGKPNAQRITYRNLFLRELGIDPWSASIEQLVGVAKSRLEFGMQSNDPDHWLDLLFSHCIEPQLKEPVFITHYPPTQAALATIAADEDDLPVALRFELVIGGMELANGYQELTDADEQEKRFQAELVRRSDLGLPEYPVDERFLAALKHGLPDCSGVALGVDRLLMLSTGAKTIQEVIPFPIDIA
jgi:elongation factor P--(R)-beta-lysine ligase